MARTGATGAAGATLGEVSADVAAMAVALGGISVAVGVGLGGVVHLGARDRKNVKSAKTPSPAQRSLKLSPREEHSTARFLPFLPETEKEKAALFPLSLVRCQLKTPLNKSYF